MNLHPEQFYFQRFRKRSLILLYKLLNTICESINEINLNKIQKLKLKYNLRCYIIEETTLKEKNIVLCLLKISENCLVSGTRLELNIWDIKAKT